MEEYKYTESLFNYIRNGVKNGLMWPFCVFNVFEDNMLIAVQAYENVEYEDVCGNRAAVTKNEYAIVNEERKIVIVDFNNFNAYYKSASIGEYAQMKYAKKILHIEESTTDSMYEASNYNGEAHKTECEILKQIQNMIDNGIINGAQADKYRQLLIKRDKGENLSFVYTSEEYLDYLLKTMPREATSGFVLFPLLEEDERKGDDSEKKKRELLMIATEEEMNRIASELNLTMTQREFEERCASVDGLSVEELLSLKSQVFNMPGLSLSGKVVSIDKISAQISQEAEERIQEYGDSEIDIYDNYR